MNRRQSLHPRRRRVHARRVAASALLVAAALAGASPVSALEVGEPGGVEPWTSQTCQFPLVDATPTLITTTSNLPSTWPLESFDMGWQVALDVSFRGEVPIALELAGAAGGGYLTGSASVPGIFRRPDGNTISFTVPVQFGAVQLGPETGQQPEVRLQGVGTFPSRILAGGFGDGQVTLGAPTFNLTALDAGRGPIEGLGSSADSDGDPSTFDVSCSGPDLFGKTITFGNGVLPPITPLPEPPSALEPSPSPVPSPLASPLPSPTPTVTPAPVESPAPSPTPTPTPMATTEVWRYDLTGKALVTTLATGSVELAGRTRFWLSFLNGSVFGKLTLNDATARLRAARLLPITASLSFTEVGELTGQLRDGTLSLQTRQALRLKNAKVFGINLVSGTCVAASPVTIPLRSRTWAFRLTTGGTLNGTFTIPPLKNCGVLTSLVSGLVAGPGNGITLTTKPGL